MRLYPAAGAGRTIAGDLAVLLLLIVFAWLGVKVHDAVAELASVGRSIQDSGRAVAATTRDTAGAIEGTFSGAAGKVQGVPVVGGDVANALREAPRGVTDRIRETGDAQGARIVRLGVEEENRTYQLARLVGWLTFLAPSLLLLAWRLPPRVRQIIALSTAQRTLSGAPTHILAARAAYNLPYRTLHRYTRDPFGDLAEGRHAALLAALADDAGVRLPTPPPRSTSRSPTTA
jgi:hypothetical protein